LLYSGKVIFPDSSSWIGFIVFQILEPCFKREWGMVSSALYSKRRIRALLVLRQSELGVSNTVRGHEHRK
jgi:hypothetical protein